MKIVNPVTAPEAVPSHTVWIDENYYLGDASERHEHGTFSTLDRAIGASEDIIVEYMTGAYKPGMTAEELYECYVTFGVDPWISGPGGGAFSAWTYAKEVAAAMAGETLIT